MGSRSTEPGMLRFSHEGRTHTLACGETFSTSVHETYRDTPASDLLQIIAAVESGEPWRAVVHEHYARSNPWLHKIITDPSRDLFFRTQPPRPTARILDIGAGWGQLALPLARIGNVCALEPTPERLQFVRAAARQEGLSANLWFVQADFLTIDFADTFDLIACVGVLEWIPRFAPHLSPIAAQREFLTRCRRVVAPGGRLVIGIENRLGLKYLLGAPDDHLAQPGIAVYDEALASRKWRELHGTSLPALIHTRAEYADLLREAGFGRISFFCAFPDYKLPAAIIPSGAATDEFLSQTFVPEHEGIRGEPLAVQDELASHYRSLARLGIASEFAPSFFITAEPG